MPGGHGAVETSNKGVALLISTPALFLAGPGALAKSVRTGASAANVETFNPWAYIQVCTIPGTVPETADEVSALLPPGADPAAMQAKREQRAATPSRSDADPAEDPAKGEGREALSERPYPLPFFHAHGS